MKKIKNLIEAGLLLMAFMMFKIMSPEAASAVGGWIGRTIGPQLGASKKAMTNIRNAFPDLEDEARRIILIDMWDNLGRVMAEYPHLKKIVREYAEVVGEEHLMSLPEDAALMIIGGHLANWELLAFYFNYRVDLPLSLLYRVPNNPYTAWLVDKARNPEDRGSYLPKSKKGVRDMFSVLQSGGRLGQLIDQKYNRGIAADFFGRPAMTSTAFVQLATKFDCPILPFRTERLNGPRFRFTLYPPIHVNGRSEEEVLSEAHRMLEGWIRERPAQWLWLHRRWDSDALKDTAPS